MIEDRHPLLSHLMTLLESARRDIVISCPEAIMPLFDNDDAISEIESNYLLFNRGLRLFKRLCLLFLPNVPWAMFIEGGTFIPDSRVDFLKDSNI